MITDQQKIEKMKSLLGTESGNHWIDFMDYISDELSEVLKRGKPTKSAIENSIIGKNGFKSWKEMVVSEEKNGGLSWNYSSFEAWKRAYSVVVKFKYLRDLELTASQINTIQRETKPNFPQDESEFKALSGQRVEKQKQMHQNSLKDAQNRNYELEVTITAQLLELDKFRQVAQQNEVLTGELAVLNQKIGSMQLQIDDRDSKLIKLGDAFTKKETEIKKLKSQNKKYSNMTLVQKFFFLFE